jgi:hypothetical protein
MNKLQKIYNFLKTWFGGNTTKRVLSVCFILLLYKLLGVFGLILCILIAMCIDLCDRLQVFELYKIMRKLFLVVVVVGVAFISCNTTKTVTRTAYSVSHITYLSKDTVTAKTYRQMVGQKEIPSLTKFAKTYLKDFEENKTHAHYAYYDTLTSQLINIKELIQNKDTTYVIEKKTYRK